MSKVRTTNPIGHYASRCVFELRAMRPCCRIEFRFSFRDLLGELDAPAFVVLQFSSGWPRRDRDQCICNNAISSPISTDLQCLDREMDVSGGATFREPLRLTVFNLNN
jgi:hypothetical protein